MAKTTRWTGGHASSNNWSEASNWDNGVPAAGDTLEFAGTTRLSPNNDISADTSFAAITFISGAGAFTIGGNRITMGGNITNNDNSLQTISLAMILSATRTVNCASGNVTISGLISESGGGSKGLIKTGSYTLTLTADNTFARYTKISDGTVSVSKIADSGTAQPLGTCATYIGFWLGDGTTTGTLLYTGGAVTSNMGFDLTGTTGGGIIDHSGSGLLKFTGADYATEAGNKSLTLQGSNGGTGEISSAIPDKTGYKTSIVKSGTITWTLSGTNTYTGTTAINAGTLKAGSTQAYGVNSAVTMADVASAVLDITGFSNSIGSITGGGSTGGDVILGTATLTIGGDNTSPAAYGGNFGSGATAGNLIFTGTGKCTSIGDNALTGSITINSGATLQRGDSTRIQSMPGLNPGIINNGAYIRYIKTGSSISQGWVISGTGTYEKTGPGVHIFTSTNTYTGTTTITEGTHLVNGSTHASSVVTVKNGATLGGSGNVYGPITLESGGIFAPGAAAGISIGTLGTANVTFSATSLYSVDLDGTTPTFDKINSGGTVALGAAANTLTVASIANSAVGKVYTIIGATSLTGTFSGKAEGTIFYVSGRYLRISYLGNNVTLTDVSGESICIGGIWKPISLISVCIGGVWKAITDRKNAVSSTWKA